MDRFWKHFWLAVIVNDAPLHGGLINGHVGEVLENDGKDAIHEYFTDMSINQTSMEWGIINYDSKSEVFSEPGDLGSIIANIHGHISGMLTGSAGKTKSSSMTYATPFWWLLQQIRTNGFPNAHLNVLASRHRQWQWHHQGPVFSATST